MHKRNSAVAIRTLLKQTVKKQDLRELCQGDVVRIAQMKDYLSSVLKQQL